MILDRLATFFDNVTLALSTATPSAAVNVPALAGRLDPIHCFVSVKGALASNKTGSVAVVLQEADDEAFTTPAAILTLNFVLAVGANDFLEFFALPASARKPFVRLSATATSTDTTAAPAISAGVSMDVIHPYAPGQYRDKGQVVA